MKQINVRHHNVRGFALLLTLIVISVMLAVGLSILDITLKQISLSTTNRDSEIAFYGAQAAGECAQSVMRDMEFAVNGAEEIDIDCFGKSVNNVSPSFSNQNRTAHWSFQLEMSNDGQDLCTEVSAYILDAREETYTHNFSNEGLSNKECERGGFCTIVFARGFNRSCSDLDSLRTVQRELTITF